jgi:hypothetical protein
MSEDTDYIFTNEDTMEEAEQMELLTALNDVLKSEPKKLKVFNAMALNILELSNS